MSSLIQRRLAGLPIGTWIEMTYANGQSITEVHGCITDTDGEESFALQTEDGQELFLLFSEVKSFKKRELVSGNTIPEMKETPSADRYSRSAVHYSDANKEIQASAREAGENGTDKENYHQTGSLVSVDKVKAEKKSIIPFFRVSVGSNEFTVQRLKDMYKSLPKNCRSSFSGMYDSFIYGSNNHDADKCRIAARRIADTAINDISSEPEAFIFAGAMLSLADNHEAAGNIFARACSYNFAAKEFYIANDKCRAGACALQAIIHESESEDVNSNELFTILEDAILDSEDIGVISANWEKIPKIYNGELDILIQSLASTAGCVLNRPQGFTSDLQQLESRYRGYSISIYTAELSAFQSYRELTIEDANQEELSSDDSNSENTSSEGSNAEVIGYVSSASWMRQSGVIIGSTGQEYVFSYKDIEDSELLTRLNVINNDILKSDPVAVQFRSENQRAIAITRVGSTILAVKTILKQREDRNVLPVVTALLKNSAAGSIDTQCLYLLLQTALEYLKNQEGLEIPRQVKQIYLDNRDKIKVDSSGYYIAILFFRALNENDTVCKMLDTALQMGTLPANMRLDYHRLYIRVLRESYEDSEDETPLRRCLEQIDLYAQDYLAAEEAGQNVTNYTQYYVRGRLIDEAECWNLLRDYEKMKGAIQGIQESGISEEDKGRLQILKRKLKAAQDKEQAEKARREKSGNDIPEPAGSEENPWLDYGSGLKGVDSTQIDRTSPLLLNNGVTDLVPFGSDNEELEDGEYIYTETGTIETAGLNRNDVMDYALSVQGDDRLAVMLSYLKAGTSVDATIMPLYKLVSLAVDNPLETQDYSSGSLLTCLNEVESDYSVIAQYCLASATLRSTFLSPDALPHNLRTLHNSVALFQEMPDMEKLFLLMTGFRGQYTIPLDNLAAYHGTDEKSLNERINRICAQAEDYYGQFISGSRRSGNGIKRLTETKKVIFAEDGAIASYLRCIAEKDFDALLSMQEEFASRWIAGSTFVSSDSVSMARIDDYIMEVWDSVDAKHHSFKLQGPRFNNLRTNLRTILRFVCECFETLQMRKEQGNTPTRNAYKRILPDLLSSAEALMNNCKCEEQSEEDPQRRMGVYLVYLTAKSLLQKMEGSWDDNNVRMCFAGFLRSDYIILNEDFLPDLQSTFCDLPEFNIFARIRNHVATAEHKSLDSRIEEVFSPEHGKHNFGTARLIERYLASTNTKAPKFPAYADDYINQAISVTRAKVNEFRRKYALAIAVGQISHGNPFLEKAESIIQYWYDSCSESENYGFIWELIENTYKYIRAESAKRKDHLLNTLRQMVINNEALFAKYTDAEERIRTLIENESFSVAEDEMNHLGRDEFLRNLEKPEALGYLTSFFEEYDADFRQVSNVATTVQNLITPSHNARNKQQKGAQSLVENWIKGKANNTERIARLLVLLGWANTTVKRVILPGDNTEMYHVRQDSSAYGHFTPMHLVAPFGSAVQDQGFDVVCLYGAFDHNAILEKIRVLDSIGSNACLILLDYALSEPDRRALARKIKRDHYHRTYLVLDRVLLCYLYNNYNGSVINRMLISVGMPFSWYQPYVAEAANYMPPEMFIGRVNELRQIEEPTRTQTDSVNLLYGGRQLGKSALLKKARADIDGKNNKRAVWVDLFKQNCAQSAIHVSEELVTKKILDSNCVTEDWSVLVDSIRRRLNDENNEQIAYLLLMLDEADSFINDSASNDYIPVSQLKILQEEMPDRFKFVIAGLHDIIRYNRASGLSNNAGIPHLKGLAIRPFSKAEANQLLLEPLSYLGFVLRDYTQATQIIAQTNYFPGLIQLYCQKLVQSVSRSDYGGFREDETPPYHISNDLIGRVLADNNFIYEIGEKFEMTLRLEPSYYLIALLLCHLSYKGETALQAATREDNTVTLNGAGYTANDIWETAKEFGLSSISSLEVEQVQTLMEELYDLNIFRRETSNSFSFASENFRGILGTELVVFEKLIKVAEKEGMEQ